MSHQPQGFLTTSIPYFILAFACTTTRALIIPNAHSKADLEPHPHGVLASHVKRQNPSSSFSFPTSGPTGSSFSFPPTSSPTFFDSSSAPNATPASFSTTPGSFSFSNSSITSSDEPPFTSATFTTTFPPSSSTFVSTSAQISFASSAASFSLGSGSSSLSTVLETSLPTSGVIRFGEDRANNSAIPIVIGTVVGCLIALSLVLCLLFLRKRRRRQLQETEKLKVEKSFGSEAGFHLLVDTGLDPTGVNPYTAPPTSQPSISLDEKSRTFGKLLTVPTTQSSTGTLSGSSAPSSPVSDYPTPTSAISQQSLLEQLNILRAQIQHVEALAGISSSGSSNSASSTQDSSEPPPEYDANLGDGRSQRGTGEKGAGLP